MISPKVIIDYLEGRFRQNYRIVKSGQEFTTNSIFADDSQKHLSINLETGLWRCFKTGKSGNFIQLVSILDNISYGKAYAQTLFQTLLIGDDPFLKICKKRVENPFFSESEFRKEFQLVKLGEGHELDSLAYDYLSHRGNLQNYHDFYLGVDGPYIARLIIPYVAEGNIFFFQGRALIPDLFPKYLNDPRIRASEILFPFDYNDPNLYITEGPMDALSLKSLGYNATCVMGSSVSKNQWDQFRAYGGNLIASFDNDESGKLATSKFLAMHSKNRISEKKIFTCSPPLGYKDWNEALVNEKEAVKASLDNPSHQTFKTQILSLLNNL